MVRWVPLSLAAALTGGCGPFLAAAQHGYTPVVEADDGSAAAAIERFKLADGLQAKLVAVEPQLANVVAFTIDAQGRFYVAETHRIKFGVFDNRDHRYWLDDDLAATTVEDRIALHRKHRSGELERDREEHERVRMLVDDDQDGIVDRSTVFADQFNDLADGIAAGLLAHDDDIWFTNIPKLWRLRDRDGDGIAEERDAIHDGYGVHFSLIGHDLHGLRVGPDRRLYFSIGDRGFHVEHEGKVHAYPHTGAVLRCELDGSQLEVVHFGLRNPQELAFDAYGNLFTGDNNSDGGDRARWVYIVEGGNTGWHIGYQWMSTRGAWNEEKLWEPRHEGQASYIVPPVDNIGHGPSGLTYYPGTGLPAHYDNHFLLCDFRGSATHSGIYALQFKPKGAGFELANKEDFIWNVLATDVEFGPDGGVYLTDWVTGWNKTGRGRIYKISNPAAEAVAQTFAKTGELLRASLDDWDQEQRLRLLAHPDQRVRFRAQFALVDAGESALDPLTVVASAEASDRLPRLHAIWALGIHARQHRSDLTRLLPLLSDSDAEVRAQTAKTLAEAPPPEAREALEQRVAEDPEARVKFFAIQSLGRIGATESVPALLEALRTNADADAHLRHAAVYALTRIGAVEPLRSALGDDARAVRLGALLALRRLGDSSVANALTDSDPLLVVEAARAIYDEPIDAAMPALAALEPTADTPLTRRILNANRWLGKTEHAKRLIELAKRGSEEPASCSEAMRVEALEIIAEWAKPAGQDRVFGNWRPLKARSPLAVRAIFDAEFGALTNDTSGPVCRAAIAAGRQLNIRAAGDRLTRVALDSERDAATRDAALAALESLGSSEDITNACSRIEATAPVAVRKTAVRLLAKINPTRSIPVLASLAEDAEMSERQNAIQTLGQLANSEADAVLALWIDRLESGTAPPELLLEITTAARDRELALSLPAATEGRESLAAFEPAKFGGSRKRGEKIFLEKDTVSCLRCHQIGGRGGEAGPSLDQIGERGRDHLLAALVEPSRDIAEGFSTVVIKTVGGSTLAGVIGSESAEELVLIDANSESTTVRQSDIVDRSAQTTSSMPAMGDLLSLRELRDVVEFLASKQPAGDK